LIDLGFFFLSWIYLCLESMFSLEVLCGFLAIFCRDGD